MQLALCSATPKALLTQDIHDNWQFRLTENTTYYNATVPGTVHTDLLNNQLIPDPYYRDNVNSVQWIENKTWEYTTQFDISPPNLLNQSRIDLVFEGLDTYATVSLNGQTILQANNMFRRWVIDVKSLLKSQGNTLTIIFNSTIPYDDEQIQNMLPLVLPSDFDSGRIFTRKAAYHYGWDWGPRLVTAGIWKSVYLQAWSSARIDYVQFNQKVITNTLAQVEANLELIVDKTQDYQISILDSNSKQVYISTHKTIQASNSTQVPVAFQIKNPKLWWVRNFGDPYLYNITVQISSGGILLDQKVTNLGIRTIELVQEDDAIGKSFYFKINGKKVFAKGGNYIPPDVFMPRVTTADYEAILGDAIAANYNFIRIWGGGNFENDIFYDICDREGILLWHDFMFANGMYSANSDDFVQNIVAEITDNVKRLRNHPSIVLWCGNNEIKNGWEDWGYQQNMTDAQKVEVYGWYMKIFLDVIPGVLQQTDTSRPYWPTSPEIGYGHPESYLRGDSHYYSVWVLDAPIENYTLGIGRFMSEYGMQGLLCMNSLKKFALPEDFDLNSTVILAHEKGTGAYGHIDYYMNNYYKPTVGFENYLYATQIMQKYAIQTAVEAHRWNKPRNMGTLMWQLNDDWPAFSWSSRDYYGTWKAVHYMLKKKYQDVIVSIVPDVDLNNNTQYQVYIVSEKLSNFKGSLHLSILDFDGTVRLTMDTNVSVPADSSQPYYTIGNYHIHGLNLNSSFVYAALTYDFDEKFSDTTFYFVRPIYMSLITPKITINANLNANQITIQADTFVVGAYIYINGVDLHLDDNYFDLLPNQPKTVNVLNQKLENIANLKDDLKVQTLYDSYSTDREAPLVKIVEETKVILE